MSTNPCPGNSRPGNKAGSIVGLLQSGDDLLGHPGREQAIPGDNDQDAVDMIDRIDGTRRSSGGRHRYLVDHDLDILPLQAFFRPRQPSAIDMAVGNEYPRRDRPAGDSGY